MSKKILVFSGKRGGYGAMKPLLRNLSNDCDIELILVLSDQHTNAFFGNTQSEVKEEFPNYTTLEMNQVSSTKKDRVIALSELLKSSASFFQENSVDLAVVYGDRGEVLTLCLALVHFLIPIAHIQGGDKSGNIDDKFRNAISMLSELHFPSCKSSSDRLKKFGVTSKSIFTVGDCHIDEIYLGNYSSKQALLKSGFNVEKLGAYALFLLHPDTLEEPNYRTVMPPIINRLLEMFDNILAVYPCSDPGYSEICSIIEEYNKRDIRFKRFKNIDAVDFWGLMRYAKLFIGNSSAGIIETAAFKLPTVNIGNRQIGRDRPTHVIDADYEINEISLAIDNARNYDFAELQSPYGTGGACDKIYKIIKSYLGQ